MQGLGDLRVIDFTSGIAGPYASKLFADAGADVIKIEQGDGDWMRRWSSTGGCADRPGDAAFFQYLNAGKRSVIGFPDDEHVKALIASADLLIEDFQTGSVELSRLDVEGLCKENPQLVVVSISPFGRTGPYATRLANEFIVQAESGSTGMRGLVTQPPYMAGGRVADFISATYAAVAGAAAVRGAQTSGQGEHIDFSMIEVTNIAATVYVDLVFSILGRPEMPGPFRQAETPSIEPTIDGWVGFNTNSRKHFDEFLKMIGREDWLGDEELASHFTRQFRLEEWNEAVWAWTRKHTTAQCIKIASDFGIPVAPVNDGKTVLEHEQLIARQVFEKNPAGDFLQPRPPYLLNGKRVCNLSSAPKLGEHTASISLRTRKKPVNPVSGHKNLPLKGLKVLDVTAWWAGPVVTNLYAMLGADVIHVESIKRYDGARTVVVAPSGDNWWEQSHLYNCVNTNKQGITLDFTDDKGRELLIELIKQSDVLVENFSPRVFETIGLTREKVLEINPQIIFARMPAFGLDGPWKNHLGFAQTMEQMSGLAWLTGHTDDQPRIQRGVCDPVAGMHAAFAILVALAERDATGKGQFLESTMVEGALNVAAEQVVEYTAYGNVMQREGNRSPYAAPQGLYTCACAEGEESWLALSVESDQQWLALLTVMGKSEWVNDPRFGNFQQRRLHHDTIDEAIQLWTKNSLLDKVLALLIEAGVPAGSLLDSRFSYLHPQFRARHFFEEVTHPVIGKHPVPGAPFRFSSQRQKAWITCPAPTMGQDNHKVLRERLGLSDKEIEALVKSHIVGTRPFNA